MKHLFCIGLTLLCLACASDPQKEMEKKIIGEWCNPYTYESTGKVFLLKKEEYVKRSIFPHWI